MDGQTLQQLFAGSNPFLAQMGEKAFNQAQQKEQANLASIMGAEQRAQAMHPLEMEGKGAVTRLNNSTAAMNEDVLASNIPAAQRQKMKLQAEIAKMDSISRAQMKEQVVRNMQLANMMEKNGGQLPQGFNLSPEEMQIFTPKNLKNIIAHGQAFMEMDPEWIAQRKKAQEAERLAQVRGQVQRDVKATPTPGKGATSSVDLPKTYGEVVNAMAKYKRASERVAYLKSILPGVSQELRDALQSSYAALKVQADAEANARLAGEVDVGATTNGKVAVRPPVDLGAAPGPVSSRPERQVNTQRITIYKDGKAVGTIPAEQKAQALQQGYTIK